MARKILLLEPNYKNKYPPIGLMKIATYHKLQDDKVEFYKGDLKEFAVSLKLKECIKELKKFNRTVSWEHRQSSIRLYLQTKRIIYIDQVTVGFNPIPKSKIEAILRKHSNSLPQNKWDRIYVSTLFTFYWSITIETILFAKSLISDSQNIFIGGVMASLLTEEIFQETGIMPFTGLLDRPGILDAGNSEIIDELPLDYSILEEITYKYPTDSAYFTFMTKGCTRKCAFCSVPKLEPTYKEKIEASSKFQIVKERFGEQRNLLLMDNNVLASPKFPDIIQEIKEMGFTVGSHYIEPNQLDIAINNIKHNFNRPVYLKKAATLIFNLRSRLKGTDLIEYDAILLKNSCVQTSELKSILKLYKEIKNIYEKFRIKTNLSRYVDFNQGTDARYVTEENMKLMSEIPIKPLRLAFDHIGIKETYIKAVRLAAKYGIKNLSNYILYNFHDTPAHFYERLKINVDLGKELNIKIFSFPMKFIPLFGEEAKHRRYIGKNWNRKFIRAVQSILNATKGIVAPGFDFFQMAFGRSQEEFMELLWMPEAYIINRNFFINNGMVNQWRTDYDALNSSEKFEANEIIMCNNFNDISFYSANPNILRLLSHYAFIREDKKIIDKEVRKLRNKYNRLIKKDVFLNLTLTHDFESNQRRSISL